ncbi:serpin family protein [Demequina sp. SO4-13]|uniref:serpin family protein n=1 Tax=Demequina sp. SO4-13 TaxID=3401027 RepID=UPI003AF80180
MTATAEAADRPAPSSDLVPDLARGIDDVGYDIFRAAANDAENTVVSPVSIGLAFGMADAGASGSVADALEAAFGFPGTGEERLEAFNAYEQALSIPPGTTGEEPSTGEDVTLPTVTIANRVYTDTDFAPRPEYIEDVETWFGAGAETVPMRSDGAAAADAMNAWIDDRTEGLIQNLYSAQSFNNASRLTLLNALYMKAAWRETLDPELTVDLPFTRLDGTAEDVPMMDATDTASAVATGDDYMAASLAYAGDALEMVVVVPDEGAFAGVRERMGSDLMAELDGAWSQEPFVVQIPRFEAGSKLNLGAVMEGQLGLDGIFGVVGLDGIGEELLIGSAIHATKVIVDEEGTEAAAVTGISVEDSGMPDPALEVIADRPFLYVIRDVDTGAALFVGQVLDPAL